MPSLERLQQIADQQGDTLLHIARRSIHQGLQTRRSLTVSLNEYDPQLFFHCATFVTLQINQQLRGCLGTLQASRPLAQDIAYNAFAAAFQDPRFPAVSRDEVHRLDIHLSLLSDSEPMHFSDQQDLLEQIEAGVDGLILEELPNYKGTFLPSVWQSLPQKSEFFNQLKRKAGLAEDYWSDSLRVFRYRTVAI